MVKDINVNDSMQNSFDYEGIKAAFSRATLIDNTSGIHNKTLYVSGTASIGPNGETLHQFKFKEQLLQTFENLTKVLEGVEFTWKNVVRTTIYLKDIERDYEEFNKLRFEFFEKMGITKFPASTCIEAKLCRPDLLCEIELIAVSNCEV